MGTRVRKDDREIGLIEKMGTGRCVCSTTVKKRSCRLGTPHFTTKQRDYCPAQQQLLDDMALPEHRGIPDDTSTVSEDRFSFTERWNPPLPIVRFLVLSVARPRSIETFANICLSNYSLTPPATDITETGLMSTSSGVFHTHIRQETFRRPFSEPPYVPFGLSHIDMDNSENIRVRASVSDITCRGFSISVCPWGGSRFYSAGASWLSLTPNPMRYQHGSFCTLSDHPHTRPKLRTHRRIEFDHPFSTPPKVISFFSMLDLEKSENWCAYTYASDIDCKGFTIHIDTWNNSKIYSATAGWVAWPKNQEGIFGGTAGTNEFWDWKDPQMEACKVDFGFQFPSVPDGFVAISVVDQSCKNNLRINVFADKVTKGGFKWHINSSGDSIMYSAGISYLFVI